jgi:hypothetical protein
MEHSWNETDSEPTMDHFSLEPLPQCELRAECEAGSGHKGLCSRVNGIGETEVYGVEESGSSVPQMQATLPVRKPLVRNMSEGVQKFFRNR